MLLAYSRSFYSYLPVLCPVDFRNRLDAVRFSVNVWDVVLHRIDADIQIIPNFLVIAAFKHQIKHIFFPRR